MYIILKRETRLYCILAFAILIPFWDGVQMNLWRNIKSILIFCWAIKYIRNRCLWKYLLSILLACSFHLTSLFFLPLYWLINKDNRTICMIISIISVVLYVVGIESFFDNIILIGVLLGGKFDQGILILLLMQVLLLDSVSVYFLWYFFWYIIQN